LRAWFIEMKSKFNKSWNSSKQPRKQVKFIANAPNHIARKFMGATLDKPLRQKHKMRSIEIRKGDEVKVMRGKFRGRSGKVGKVDIKNARIQIDGLQREKRGGEKVETWFHPSNVKITVLNDSDNRRLKRLKKIEKSEEKKETKAKEKTETTKTKAKEKTETTKTKAKEKTETTKTKAPKKVAAKKLENK
jgi:large subunit ribosomal protein L24